MESAVSYRWNLIAFCALLAALGSAIPGAAQTVSGQARAVQSIVNGLFGATVTTLADTGKLSGSDDAREASAPTGSVPSVVAANTLHATTIGWPDQVKPEASVAGLTVTVSAVTVCAQFAMAPASPLQAVSGGACS